MLDVTFHLPLEILHGIQGNTSWDIPSGKRSQFTMENHHVFHTGNHLLVAMFKFANS